MIFRDCLANHIATHKDIQPIDIIKFTYQATFGAEHLLMDINRASKMFFDEYEVTEITNVPLKEDLNEEYCRVNLSAWKASGNNPKDLFKIFVNTAKVPSRLSSKDMDCNLKIAQNVVTSMQDYISLDSFNVVLNEYSKADIHPVHHSDVYRRIYTPSYRVVSISLLNESNLFHEETR